MKQFNFFSIVRTIVQTVLLEKNSNLFTYTSYHLCHLPIISSSSVSGTPAREARFLSASMVAYSIKMLYDSILI